MLKSSEEKFTCTSNLIRLHLKLCNYKGYMKFARLEKQQHLQYLSLQKRFCLYRGIISVREMTAVIMFQLYKLSSLNKQNKKKMKKRWVNLDTAEHLISVLNKEKKRNTVNYACNHIAHSDILLVAITLSSSGRAPIISLV